MFQPTPSTTSSLPYSNGHLSPPLSKSTVNGIVTPASESDLSEALDLPIASASLPNSERYDVKGDARPQSTDEESEEDAIGEDDPDFDMVTPPTANQGSLDDAHSSSEESPQQRKRKAGVEPDDYMLNDPELYGLRRSVSFGHPRPRYATNPVLQGRPRPSRQIVCCLFSYTSDHDTYRLF
jgi:chromodomain-helicase-DNA-binding protein 1